MTHHGPPREWYRHHANGWIALVKLRAPGVFTYAAAVDLYAGTFGAASNLSVAQRAADICVPEHHCGEWCGDWFEDTHMHGDGTPTCDERPGPDRLMVHADGVNWSRIDGTRTPQRRYPRALHEDDGSWR